MSYYRVTGWAETETKIARKRINKVVLAFSSKDAAEVALVGDSQLTWVDDNPDVRTATRLESLEAQALEDWNLQLPTSQPLALSRARGEL